MKNVTVISQQTYLAFRCAWKADDNQFSAETHHLREAERFRQHKKFGHLGLTDAEVLCVMVADRLCASSSCF